MRNENVETSSADPSVNQDTMTNDTSEEIENLPSVEQLEVNTNINFSVFDDYLCIFKKTTKIFQNEQRDYVMDTGIDAELSYVRTRRHPQLL